MFNEKYSFVFTKDNNDNNSLTLISMITRTSCIQCISFIIKIHIKTGLTLIHWIAFLIMNQNGNIDATNTNNVTNVAGALTQASEFTKVISTEPENKVEYQRSPSIGIHAYSVAIIDDLKGNFGMNWCRHCYHFCDAIDTQISPHPRHRLFCQDTTKPTLSHRGGYINCCEPTLSCPSHHCSHWVRWPDCFREIVTSSK